MQFSQRPPESEPYILIYVGHSLFVGLYRTPLYVLNICHGTMICFYSHPLVELVDDGVARVDLHGPLSRHHSHLPAVRQSLRPHDALHVRAVCRRPN